MGFDDAVLRCLTKSSAYSGRARPSEFWWFAALYSGAVGAALGALAFMPSLTAAMAMPMLALTPAMIAVTVRRLHDIGVSGWTLVFLVPVLGQLVLIAWLTGPGVARRNRHGPEPAQDPERTLLYARSI